MENEKKQLIRKRLLTALFILFNAAVVAVTACVDYTASGSDVSDRVLQDIRPTYLLAALCCFVIACLAETVIYCVLMKQTVGRYSLRTAFETFIVGRYYDNITPLGIGGQPFQILYLSRKGFDAGKAGALPVAGFLSSQIAFITISIFAFIFGSGFINTVPLLVAAIIGMLFYAFIPAAIIIFAFFPSMMEHLVHFFVNPLSRMRVIRHPVESENKIIATLREYTESLSAIGRGHGIMSKVFLLALLYRIMMCSVPYFVLRAFGCVLPYGTVLCTCVFVYLSVSFVPTPGNSGFAEGSFYAMFSVLTDGYLFWAMLMWRFFCFYSFILLGLAILSRGAMRKRRVLG